MATYTENLHLKKPNAEDFYNIEDFNGNADIIDEAIANKGDASTIGSLQNDVNSLIEYTQDIGGFKKFTTVGTHTFKVPIGITSIKVSGIGAGGGGGGGGGYGSGGSAGVDGGGGGSGGHGYYLIDQQIQVTEGEILTIKIGNGGSGGNGSSGYNKGINGNDGGTTKLLRCETELLVINGGTGGNGGMYGTPSGGYTNYGTGGKGGALNGNYGEIGKSVNYSSVPQELRGASGGEKAISYIFGDYGAGGKGGRGSYNIGFSSYSGTAGSAGTNGALAICFGGISFSDISFNDMTSSTKCKCLFLSSWHLYYKYSSSESYKCNFKILTNYVPDAYDLTTFKEMLGENAGDITNMIISYDEGNYFSSASINNNVFKCTIISTSNSKSITIDNETNLTISKTSSYQIF